MAQNTLFKKIRRECEEKGTEYMTLLTLDLRGKLHSLNLPFRMFTPSLMGTGVGFDASSYGFSKAERSDMVMIPDLETYFYDPFSEKKTAVFMANIHLTNPERTRFSQDVRYIIEKAKEAIIQAKIGTSVMVAPEYEFFIFETADFGVDEEGCFYYLEKESTEKRNFYHSCSPDDLHLDFKNEATSILLDLGVPIKYHHHEVAVNQHEIETGFGDLLQSADQAVMVKYVLFNLAKKYELFVTFMPKPFYGNAGSGWHVHQFVLDGLKNIFLNKNGYANFSKKGLAYITGMLFHAQSLCALTSPSTNSYKRLVRGYEAPVAAIFAKSNRNAAIRIPTYAQPAETRLEYRPGDASANPYLALSAMVMAGVDGILKNLKPEDFHFGPYDSGIPESRALRKKIRMLPESLSEALDQLEKDHAYLKYGDVFSDKVITQWLKIKRDEVDEMRYIPHPKEFELYFGF